MRSGFLQQFLAATDLAGNVLPTQTIVVLLACWTEVDIYTVLHYEERTGPMPLLVVRKKRLASIVKVDLTTIDRHVAKLRRARWLAVGSQSGNGQLYLRLLDSIDRTRLIASGKIDVLTNVGSFEDEHTDRRSLQTVGAIPANGGSDPCRNSGPRTSPSSTGINKNINTPPTPPGGRGGLCEHEATAIEILRGAICPEGCARIPATPHGARFLTAQLRGGWPVDEARALVAAMPAIVARGLREAQFYTAAAFDGERFDRWLVAQAALEQLERREQQTPPSPTASKPTERVGGDSSELEELVRDFVG